MTPTPTDLHHRVRVPVRSCALPEQRAILRDAFRLALRTDRRVFALGLDWRAGRVLCSLPGCDHGGSPSVIPWTTEIELAANGWVRPWRSIALPLHVDLIGPTLHAAAWAIAVDWHPAIWLPEWWLEDGR